MTAGVIAGVLFAGASPAAAASFTARMDASLTRPVFAGDAVAWAAPTPAGGAVLRAVAADERVRELARVEPIPGLRARLSASSGLLALQLDAEVCPDPDACRYGAYDVRAAEVRAQLPGGTLACVSGFDPGGSCGPTPCGDLSLEGTVLAFGLCGSEASYVRDFAPGGPEPSAASVPLFNPHVSGDWIAGSRDVGGRVEMELMRWRTGETVFTHAAGVVDVEPDGTVVFVEAAPNGESGEVAWASASSPMSHPIVPADEAEVLSAGKRVAIVNSRLVEGLPAPAEIAVFDLTGRLVAREREPALATPVAFDGRRLAYVSAPCSVRTLVVHDLAEASPKRASGRCPAARLSGPVGYSRVGLTVAARCDDLGPLGCLGRIRLVGSARTSGGRSDSAVLADRDLSLLPGERQELVMPLRPAQRRWLAHHREVRVAAVSAGRPSVSSPGGAVVRRFVLRVRRR